MKIQVFLECLHCWIQFSLDNRLVIFELALVELIGRELSNLRMHPILDPQHVVLDPAFKEPLEHATAVSRLIAIL